MKLCVAWADKAGLPQPLLCRLSVWDSAMPAGTGAPPAPSHSVGWLCMARRDQLGSCLGTSWPWDQQDISVYECLSGQHELLFIKPKRSEV